MDEKKNFLGIGWSFPPAFSKVEKKVKMVSDEDDIKESLEIILSTQVGERIMQPAFGANLNSFIFQPINEMNRVEIKDLVFTAIYNFEPRIRPDDVILTDLSQEGKMILDISYIVKATNARHNLVYPFYLEEGTLL
ncbi:baseplate protein [Bacteroidia bacterium]|nr:baseplate protein [Bacteroidia bacterium]